MTTAWTEENFLERMTHSARRAAGSCPEPQTMDAYVQGAASGFVGGAVERHIAECSDCAELRDRLVKFGGAGTGAADMVVEQEWVNAEKRLQIQTEAFLRRATKAGARGLRPADSGAAAERGFRFVFWRTEWAAAALVAVLVSAGIYVARRGGAITPQTSNVAQNPETAAPSVSAQKSPDASVLPPMAVANHDARGDVLNPAAESSTIVTTTRVAAAASSKSNSSTSPKSAAGADTEVAANSNQVNTTAPLTTAAGETNAASASNGARPVVTSPGTASELTSVSSKSSHNAAGRVATQASGARRAALPSAILLDAGTRVWIVFRSVARDPDGSFTFQGSLLEPIARSGVEVVAKDTEIDGAGKVAGGKTSLYIQGIVIRGAHYALKGASGAASSKANAGQAVGVAFDAGQVQEMWLSGASVYERTTDGSAAGTQH